MNYRRTPARLLARYLVGMAAGLCDFARNVPLRDRIASLVIRDGIYMDGFDLTADLYLLRPIWLRRRFTRRAGR